MNTPVTAFVSLEVTITGVVMVFMDVEDVGPAFAQQTQSTISFIRPFTHLM
jgi:hypothetical protein